MLSEFFQVYFHQLNSEADEGKKVQVTRQLALYALMKSLLEQKSLSSCLPGSRFSFLQYVKSLLDELESTPIDDALARDFMAEYAASLSETG